MVTVPVCWLERRKDSKPDGELSHAPATTVIGPMPQFETLEHLMNP
jgi:hypothetical protein